MDLEVTLVTGLQWSLRDIDETDCEELIRFVFHQTKGETGTATPGVRRVYADEVVF